LRLDSSPKSDTSFCPLGAHGVQSSAYADVNIWSGNEKERSCWRDGRGIGGIGEKMGEKMGKKMGKKMEGKMGEERCEGERETAQVSSSVGVVTNVQRSQFRDPWLGGIPFGPFVKS
jgi:hypothetical protein